MSRPLAIEIPFNHLPQAPEERHELLVDIFGIYFTWALENGFAKAIQLVESEEERKKLGRIRAEPFEQFAQVFAGDQRQVAYAFAEQTLKAFAQALLALLTAEGTSHPMGNHHAIRFRLVMEIIEGEDLNIVLEEVINRDGKKVFYDYLNRWLANAQERKAATEGLA